MGIFSQTANKGSEPTATGGVFSQAASKQPSISENIYSGLVAQPPQDPNLPDPGKASLANLKYNVGKLPGQLADVGKKAFNAVTSSEQGFGSEIAAAISAPSAQKQADELNKQHQDNIDQLKKMSSANKAAGKDSSHIDMLIQKMSAEPMHQASDVVPAINDSNEKVIGNAVGMGADIVSGGALESGAKAVAKTSAKGVVAGVTKGAIAGAKAGVVPGAVQGLASGLKSEQGVGGVAASTVEGGATGAVAGAVGGGVLGGVKAEPKPQVDNTLQDAISVTKPVLNKKENIAALERSGQPGGATIKGPLGTYQVAPSPRDIKVAGSVQDVVSPKASPIDNIVAVNNKIEHVAENEVRPVLQANPMAFNLKTLNAHIRDNVPIPNYIKADPILQKTYDLTRESMIEEAAQNPKTLEGLWDSRISFDHTAERQIGSLNPTDTKVAVIKQAVLDTRKAVNDYIAQNLPNGNADFTAKMQQMNHMYEARSNIAEANYKLLNSNAVSRWIKQNPAKAKALKIGAGLVGLGVAGDYAKHLVIP